MIIIFYAFIGPVSAKKVSNREAFGSTAAQNGSTDAVVMFTRKQRPHRQLIEN